MTDSRQQLLLSDFAAHRRPPFGFTFSPVSYFNLTTHWSFSCVLTRACLHPRTCIGTTVCPFLGDTGHHW